MTTRYGYEGNLHVRHMSWPPSLNETQKQALKQGQIIIVSSSPLPGMRRFFG